MAGRFAGAQLEGRIERSLVWLLFGRLAVSIVCFAIAIGLDTVGARAGEDELRGLFWTVAFAFLATALSGACLGRIRRPVHFAGLQLVADAAF